MKRPGCCAASGEGAAVIGGDAVADFAALDELAVKITVPPDWREDTTCFGLGHPSCHFLIQSGQDGAANWGQYGAC